jgi:ATP-dependent DNA helicase PIF1
MPPHELKLKVGAPVMLLRNLNSAKRQCNGTRAVIRGIYTNIIDVEIIAGANIGERVFLPRITLSTKGTDLPFVLNRHQLPIKLAFCMSIK